MALKLKKRNIIVMLAILSILVVPLAYSAYTGVVEKTFGVELWISNNAPLAIIDVGRTMVSADPVEAGSTTVHFVVNVTDINGEDDINETGTFLNLTLGSWEFSQYRSNVTCINISKIGADQKVVFNCSVKMKFFDNNSANWVINITGKDIAGAIATNDTQRFTYNELSAMTFHIAWINFTSMTLGATDQAAQNPLIMNNTGNDDFTQINITAASLIGTSTSSQYIGAGNFTVNFTSAVAGDGMPLGLNAQTIPGPSAETGNLTLPHGSVQASADYYDELVAARGNQSLWFWVDVPSSGLSSQKYNNTWNITVIDS